jgi:hypothetical protein
LSTLSVSDLLERAVNITLMIPVKREEARIPALSCPRYKHTFVCCLLQQIGVDGVTGRKEKKKYIIVDGSANAELS